MVNKAKIAALLLVACTLLLPIMSGAQSGYSKKPNLQSDSLKTKIQMENKIVVGKIVVPKNSIEAFRKQLPVTPNYLKTLAGYVKGEMFEMTDGAGSLHVLSIVVWYSEESYQNAQQKLTAFYKEISFDRMAFREKLNIVADYSLYVRLQE
jgi:hypothetical protein